MALSNSPRKVVPLATGDESRPKIDHSGSISTTTRVFFCGVVVEGSESGRRLPEEIEELVLSLGDVLGSEIDRTDLSASDEPCPVGSDRTTRKRLADSSALLAATTELLITERKYVQRLQTLKTDYADPLRNFARSKNTAILPAREARILFGNIDNLLPVNEAFLLDLEKMMAPNGAKMVGGVGDVALRHFKDLRGFEQYKQYYVQREDALQIVAREKAKRGSPFAAYIDRIQLQTSDPKNRVGLSELIMEPVQRIPRYTLMFKNILKNLPPGDPQRAKLLEADEIASKIAQAETDEHTKRAATFYCLSSTISDFPPDLFSYSRRHFIDCIDVEDSLGELPLSSTASISSSASGVLHCTLFLFDDKLLIVKRPGNGEKGGRALSGLDELDKLMKAGGIPTAKKKSGMICKGVVEITDVVATEVGGADFHLYLESPPQDQGDRWSGRSFRSFSVVHPPAPVNLDPPQTEADKARFLENLWNVQAKFRARSGQSVVLKAADMEVEAKRGRTTIARTYYNVYQRTAFLQEQRKTKVVVHIDALGSADRIPFGVEAPPFVVIRLQPLAGGVCRYKVTSSDSSDPGEEDIVQTARIPSRIVLTIHQFGLFEFRTGRNSRPSTPTARSKASIFGLDAISRNLFNSRPASSMGDFFAGSVNSNRRSKSTVSRSSTYTSTTGDGSLMKFSHRSNSTTSAATTVDDDASFFARSPKSKKLLKRGASPGSISESDSRLRRSPSRSPSRGSTRSRATSISRLSGMSDDDDDHEELEPISLGQKRPMNQSERDLAMQLALARRNSKNQNDRPNHRPLDRPGEDTIFEDPNEREPRSPSRASRISRDSNSTSQCTVTAHSVAAGQPSRSPSRHSDHHIRGPRSPSPLHQRTIQPDEAPPPPPEASKPGASGALRATGIPRSKRQPFNSTGNIERSAKSGGAASATIEPLSIKKKTSVHSHSAQASPTPAARRTTRGSPLSKTRSNSPRQTSPLQNRSIKASSGPKSTMQIDDFEHVLRLGVSTKDDVGSSHRAVKRIKLEIENVRVPSMSSVYDISRPSSPVKGLRTPQRNTPAMTKAALERLEEMRQAIGQRQAEITPSRSNDEVPSQDIATPFVPQAMDGLLQDADRFLVSAASNQDSLQAELKRLADTFRERAMELERTKQELANAKRQCEVVKSLLVDATTEKEIMYEAFNEELDGMYKDINLPDDEAWQAMTSDLRTTKEARNVLSKENSQLKRRLAEIELKQDEWATLLRSHGLIPDAS